MNDNTRTIGKLYVAGTIWFVVMLVAALAAHLSLSAFYWAIDASPVMAALTTMSIAIVMATSLVRIGWVRLASSAHELAGRQVADASVPGVAASPEMAEDPSGATLVAIR